MNTVPHGIDANYRTTIRIFPSMVEVVTRTINWQLELARSANCGLKAPKRKREEVELSQDDIERKNLENLNRSIRRAKTTVRWLIQRLGADHMVTLNYRENMLDTDRLKKDFDQFRRLVVARYPDWKYIAIKEPQDRGSLHLHMAVKGRQDINYLRACWYKVLGCSGARGADALGAVHVRGPSKRWGDAGSQWRQDKLAQYLTKYLYKHFDLSEHSSKRYWASKGLPSIVVQRYWLGSQNITDMIKDTFDLAMLCGIQDMADFYQSHDRTLLYLSGVRNPKLTIQSLDGRDTD